MQQGLDGFNANEKSNAHAKPDFRLDSVVNV
jgi:hypothetical protein